MWRVYFLELATDDVYVGSTNDLKPRIAGHRTERGVSTKGHLPLILNADIAVETATIARSLERYFKTGSGKAVARKPFW